MQAIYVRVSTTEQAEHGYIPADAKGQGQHSYESETGILAQHARAVANVHEKVFEGWPLPDFAAALLNQEDVAKFPASGEGRFFPRHAAGHQFIDFFREVLLNLRGEVAIEMPA